MKKSMRIWIKALRSGKYKQTKEALADKNGGYCCLGVACELYNKTHKNKVNLFRGDSTALADDKDAVRIWLGLRSCIGNYARNKSLAGDNDDGKSFKEIADIIGKKYDYLIEKKRFHAK